MRAILRYARIAPKKANLIAALVRRQGVREALTILSRLPKKGAQLLRELIASAAANTEHNARQQRHTLFVKRLTVQKGSSSRRYIPMARGRARPIEKATSHISVELGVLVPARTEPVRSGGPEGGKPVTKVVAKEDRKEKKEEKADVQHVDSLPSVGAPSTEKKVAVEDPHAKGFSPKASPKGPIFIPHQRGARGT